MIQENSLRYINCIQFSWDMLTDLLPVPSREDAERFAYPLDKYKEFPVKKVAKKSGAAESTRHLGIVTGMILSNVK